MIIHLIYQQVFLQEQSPSEVYKSWAWHRQNSALHSRSLGSATNDSKCKGGQIWDAVSHDLLPWTKTADVHPAPFLGADPGLACEHLSPFQNILAGNAEPALRITLDCGSPTCKHHPSSPAAQVSSNNLKTSSATLLKQGWGDKKQLTDSVGPTIIYPGS